MSLGPRISSSSGLRRQSRNSSACMSTAVRSASSHYSLDEQVLIYIMSHYGPPPPTNQRQYNALYPATPSVQQAPTPEQQGHLQYSNFGQPIYPKVNPGVPGLEIDRSQMQQLAQDLQQQTVLQEHQRQQMQHVAQTIQPQPMHNPGRTALSPETSHQAQQENLEQKKDRLQKACDSCSLRKVKVRQHRL